VATLATMSGMPPRSNSYAINDGKYQAKGNGSVALKDLLVYVDQSHSAPARLHLAADLARRHSSGLTALFVGELSLAQRETYATAELGLVSAAELDRLDRSIFASITEAADRMRVPFEAFGREHGLRFEWRAVPGPASTVVPQHARCADLCIVGHSDLADGASVGYTFSEHLLFVIGRPVLFVPALGSFATLGRHIVVAWNSSRAATRAVNDALPLIERAEQTTVLTVNSVDFVERYHALPPDQIVEHLRRHGASVDLVELKNVPSASIADALQAEARRLGADITVAGAFGHPKLWEKLLGGVTRELLDRMVLPTLMSY
jgi:nucleotide-binding universal stress UspA family protein